MKPLTKGWTVAAGLAVVLCAVTPAAADTSTPTPVSPAVASHNIDQVALLAGDAQWLAYAQLPTLGDGSVDNSTAEVMTYDGSGSPQSLGALPVGDDDQAQTYSIEGSVLTAASYSGTLNEQTVSWWNLANHTSGSGVLAVSDLYVGSSNDGWIYSVGDTMYDESTLGVVKVVDATVPFGSGSYSIVSGTVGPSGAVLVSSDNEVTYVSFGGKATRLDLNRTKPGYHYLIQCGGTSATNTVCADQPVRQVSDIHQGPAAKKLIVKDLPLDGKPGVSAPDGCAGTSIVYDDPDYSIAPGAISAFATATRLICADEFVSSRAAKSGKVHRSTYQVANGYYRGDPPILNSLGHAVVTNRAHTVVETVTSATASPKRLFNAPASPVTVGSFALSPGQIAWSADTPASSSAADDVVNVASVHASGGTLALGSTRQAASGVGWSLVAQSGVNSAYEVPKTVHGTQTWVVDVVSPYRTTKLTCVVPSSVSLSGNRLLYLTTAASTVPRERYLLLNVDTGSTTTVKALEGSDDTVALAPKLWGSEILYGGMYTPLDLLNITTGGVLQIPQPAGYAPTSVYFQPLVYGPEIAWVGSLPSGEDHGVIVNVNDLSHPIDLGADDFAYALTNDGALTYQRSFSTPFDNPLTLRGYGATDPEVPIGLANTLVSVPKLDSNVLAWRTPDYQLEATAIADQPLTPLYLGAPYAPSAFTVAAGAWSALLPYSAPLTSCQVVISRSGTTVRMLPCAAAAMSLGDAAVSWDGKNGTGQQVAAGTYTWTSTVSGTSDTTDTRTGSIAVS